MPANGIYIGNSQICQECKVCFRAVLLSNSLLGLLPGKYIETSVASALSRQLDQSKHLGLDTWMALRSSKGALLNVTLKYVSNV